MDLLYKNLCRIYFNCWFTFGNNNHYNSIPHPGCKYCCVCVVPLLAGYTHKILIERKGEHWFRTIFLPKFKPVSIFALLLTLILLFAFQGNIIVGNPLIILLVAIPLIIQTYFIFFVTWIAGKKLKLPHNIASPAALIGASHFFELAVAVAIALFGLQSPAAMVPVVGVLVEVPVMLSLVKLANKWKY